MIACNCLYGCVTMHALHIPLCVCICRKEFRDQPSEAWCLAGHPPPLSFYPLSTRTKQLKASRDSGMRKTLILCLMGSQILALGVRTQEKPREVGNGKTPRQGLLHPSQWRPPHKGGLDSTITMIARILSRHPRLVQPPAWRYLTTETYKKSSLWMGVGTRR